MGLTWCHSGGGDGCTEVKTLGTTEVENNQTSNPTANPRRDNVAIYRAPTFPKAGKGLGFPSEGFPWLVNSRKVAMKTALKQNTKDKNLTGNISRTINF